MRRILTLLLLIGLGSYANAQMTATFDKTINTLCLGVDCDWDGPSILINEIQIAPSGNIDGSLSGDAGINQGKGEWIELYNPDLCNPVDISCYYLGNAAQGSDAFSGQVGGGFQLPQGTIVPPAGFCLVRGVNANPVPAASLVENGGNVVEVVVPAQTSGDGVCSDDPGSFLSSPRLWFPNAGGWFAFYDADGVPQDAISWGSAAGVGVAPCVPQHSTCNTGVTSLANYNNIPNDRKQNIYQGGAQTNNNTIRRMPDGGDWVLNQKSTPGTPGACNDPNDCFEPGSSTCAGTATVNVTGGSGNYSYVWSDSESQMTQTAEGLCEGTYTVTVTDNDSGETQTFSVEIEDLELEPTIVSTVSPACGNNNGEVVVGSGTIGESPYTFSMNGGSYQDNGGTFSGLTADSYDFIVKDANGCTGEISQILNDEGGISFDDIEIVSPTCDDTNDGSATAEVSEGTEPYTYTWSDSDGNTIGTGTTITDIGVGDYSLHVIDENGCSSTQPFTVSAPSASDASFTLTDFCDGDANAATNVVSSGGTFAFSPDLNDGATINPNTGSISNGVPGTTYTVEYTVANGCASSTQTVTVHEIPDASFTASPEEGVPPLEVDFENTSSTGNSYHWDLGDGQHIYDYEPENPYIYDDAGTFPVVLEVTNAGGCTNSYSVTIEVVYPGMDYTIPNIFTPNGDGKNDFFKLVEHENVAYVDVVILNRWGNVVYEYEGNDVDGFIWNGKIKNTGADVNDGVYFYKVIFTSLAGEEKVEQGFVHVNRDH